MNEKELENLILEYCSNIKNVFAWKNQTTGIFDTNKKTFRKINKYQINGVSDIILFMTEQVFFIEIKAPLKTGEPRTKEKLYKLLRQSQVEFMNKCNQFEITYLVFDNFDLFKTWINTGRYGYK